MTDYDHRIVNMGSMIMNHEQELKLSETAIDSTCHLLWSEYNKTLLGRQISQAGAGKQPQSQAMKTKKD